MYLLNTRVNETTNAKEECGSNYKTGTPEMEKAFTIVGL